MDEEIIRKSIFSTAAIEGNSLSETDVNKIIDGTSSRNLKEKLSREIINLKSTYELLDSLSKQNDLLITEEIIRKLHKEITKEISYGNNIPGEYRNHKVKVGDTGYGGIYTPPYIKKDISLLMIEFCKWINSEKILDLNPIVRAALAHYHLGIIHPFGDGNGRTARAVESLILKNEKIKYVPVMLSNFYYSKMDDYYIAYSDSLSSSKKEITPFIKFVLQGFVNSLKDIKKRITTFIRLFTLEDYYKYLKNNKHLTQRQYELLSILIKSTTNIKFKQLFTESPFRTLYKNVTERTARRDLNSLLNMGLITKDDNDSYLINLKALEQ